MRLLMAAVAMTGVLASSALAEPMDSLRMGSIGFAIATLPPIVADIPGETSPVAVTRSGPNITGLTFTGVFASAVGVVLPVTDPGAAPIKGIQATLANGDANFISPTTMGSFGGTMPLIGANKVCLFGPCSNAIANLTVPVDVVGEGGIAFVTAAVNITVVGAPWTTGTVAIGTITQMGNLDLPTGVPAMSTTTMGTVMNTMTNDGFALVTPVFVSTNIGASAVVPVFGFLDFVITRSTPEPGTIGMFGAIVALIAMGVAQSRKA